MVGILVQEAGLAGLPDRRCTVQDFNWLRQTQSPNWYVAKLTLVPCIALSTRRGLPGVFWATLTQQQRRTCARMIWLPCKVLAPSDALFGRA